jgi:hypothetical protein
VCGRSAVVFLGTRRTRWRWCDGRGNAPRRGDSGNGGDEARSHGGERAVAPVEAPGHDRRWFETTLAIGEQLLCRIESLGWKGPPRPAEHPPAAGGLRQRRRLPTVVLSATGRSLVRATARASRRPHTPRPRRADTARADSLSLEERARPGPPAPDLCALFGADGERPERRDPLARAGGLPRGEATAPAQDAGGLEWACRAGAKQPLLRARDGELPATGGPLLRSAVRGARVARADAARPLRRVRRVPGTRPAGAIAEDRILLHANAA